MKKIDIVCILDMSGSMCSIIEKAREGFNNFLKEQKESDNDINFSLAFFDTEFFMPYRNVNIQEVKKLNEKTYYARGGTALLDAIGFSLDSYIDDLATVPKYKRAEKTLVVIQTDGFENSSKVYDKNLIRMMVTDMRENFNTEFIFLGADENACLQAESMGIDTSNAFRYSATDDGISVAYANINNATNYYVNNDVKTNLFQQ